MDSDVETGLHDFRVELAKTPEDLRCAQRLRYEIFVEEMGGDGAQVDHDARLERDRYDAHCDHLLLRQAGSNRVVGVYRLMRAQGAEKVGGFYSAGEYDLGPLLRTGRPLLELGRSCLHRDVRGGSGLHLLWAGLAEYIRTHGIELLFGVASFRGSTPDAHAAQLSLLHHRHLAPSEYRPTALEHSFQNMNLLDEAQLDRKAAMIAMPGLIKAYLRLGGHVGEGAFIDHDFNTTDVCLVLDTARLGPRHRQLYAGADR